MIALVLWLGLQAAPEDLTQARLSPARVEAQLGEPVEWLLQVEHAASARVKLPAPLPVDRAWVWTAEPAITRGPHAHDAARAHTIVRLEAMALEPGDLAPPLEEIELVAAHETARLRVEARTLHVVGLLAPEEDAARPLLGFRELPEGLEGGQGARVLLGVAALAALLAVGGFVTWRVLRRRARAPARRPATPLERLAALGGRAGSDPAAARDLWFELTCAVRDGVDAALGVERSGLTDEAWSAAVAADERLPAGVRASLPRLLAEAERVKYAQEVPTRFAVEEALARGRDALEALAATPPQLAAQPAQERAA